MTDKTPKATAPSKTKVTRRTVLKGTAATAGLAVGAGVIDGFPAVHADDPITIRYAGTGVNAFRELSEKCKEDIGINIQYTTLTTDDVVKRAVTQPTSFDLLDSEYWSLKKIVPSGNLKGMDVSSLLPPALCPFLQPFSTLLSSSRFHCGLGVGWDAGCA